MLSGDGESRKSFIELLYVRQTWRSWSEVRMLKDDKIVYMDGVEWNGGETCGEFTSDSISGIESSRELNANWDICGAWSFNQFVSQLAR